jgi:broad specificity polyphosphatase/5'/3'-nucleotidase SurE
VHATTVLNVNYPAIPLAAARGVTVARQSRVGDLHLVFQSAGADTYESRELGGSSGPHSPDSDVALLGKGYVTVTPISAMLGGTDTPLDDLEHRLGATRF